MCFKRLLLPFCVAIAAASLPVVLSGNGQSSKQVSASGRPRLVVLLVVDQMRGDYPLRYGDRWTGGLHRLFEKGANFEQAAYPYFYTVTCAGHATISTGAFPKTHGIIGNSWFDRASGRSVECASDPGAQTISYGRPVKGGKSAARLMTSTLADNLRTQLAIAPRVVTMSVKERTAIMLAGHGGDSVTWFDASAGALATSSAFASAPVPFVERFVKAHPVDRDLQQSWNLKQPANFYLFADAAAGERPPSYWTSSFPHPLRTEKMKGSDAYEAWIESPFSDSYLEQLAETAIDSLQLGKGPGTDFLAISFSALDYVGHDFGPQSYEVQDLLLQLDATVGRLLTHLDLKVGSSNYVVALVGDHGVAPIPEQMAAVGIGAGRIAGSVLASAVERSLSGSIGGAKAVAQISGGQIYLSTDARRAVHADSSLRKRIVQEVEQIPGIATALFTDEPNGEMDEVIRRAVMASYFNGRSADLVAVQRPYWLFGGDDSSATSHGTPYRYDTWVPLVFYGRNVKQGRFAQPVTPADLAPTLGWMCGVTLPHLDGRPLIEAAAPRAKKGT